MLRQYVMLKKRTLFLVVLAAAGLVGYHFYKHHRRALLNDMNQLADDAETVVEKGAARAKQVAEEVKK